MDPKKSLRDIQMEEGLPLDFDLRSSAGINVRSVAVNGHPDFDASYSRFKERMSLFGINIE